MALFKTNYENLDTGANYGAVDQGEYEMVINKAGENATPNGAETFQVDLIVRNDLKKVKGLENTNGKYANRHIFNDNWKRKATQQYDLESMEQMLYAAGVPDGTEINSMQDFANHLIGKPVRVYVKKQWSDYKGEDENQVAPWNYSPTQFPEVQHEFKNDKDKQVDDPYKNNATEDVDISDSDLPF